MAVLSRTKLEKLSAFGKPPARPGFAADKEPNGWPQSDTLEGGHLDEQGGACQRARWDLRAVTDVLLGKEGEGDGQRGQEEEKTFYSYRFSPKGMKNGELCVNLKNARAMKAYILGIALMLTAACNSFEPFTFVQMSDTQIGRIP